MMVNACIILPTINYHLADTVLATFKSKKIPPAKYFIVLLSLQLSFNKILQQIGKGVTPPVKRIQYCGACYYYYQDILPTHLPLLVYECCSPSSTVRRKFTIAPDERSFSGRGRDSQQSKSMAKGLGGAGTVQTLTSSATISHTFISVE